MIPIRNSCLSLCFFSAFICFFSFSPAASAEKLVRVGVYDLQPLCSLTPGSSGRTADNTLFGSLIRHFAKKEGWRIQWIRGTLEQGFERLSTQEIDLLAAAPYLPETQGRFSFTAEPVISTWAQVFTPSGSSLQSILDLNGKAIGILKNDPYNHELRSIMRRFDISCSFVEFKSYSDILNALEKKWVDAGIVDRIAGFYAAEHHSLNKTSIIFSPVQLRFAVPKGKHKNLVPAIDYHLQRQKKMPGSLYHELMDDIFSNPQTSRLFAVLKLSLAAASFLLIGVLAISFTLRHQVQTKTAELVRKNHDLQKEVAMRREAEQALIKQTRYLTALHETSLGVVGKLKLDELFKTIVSYAADLAGTVNGFIFLYDEHSKELSMRVGLGAFEKVVGYTIKPGEGLAGSVWKHGEPLCVENYASWPKRIRNPVFESFACAAALPLKINERVAGVFGLAYQRADKTFGTAEIGILSRFAELASIALYNAQLYERVEKELRHRKQAEVARLLLSTAIEQSAESVLITDTEGFAVYANSALEQETGYTLPEIADKKACDLIYSGQTASQYQDIEATIARGGTWTGRFTNIKKDGTSYQVEERISPVRNEEGTITNYVSLRRDITGTMQLEQQLRQAQKMEAIGTLAGGIAHDFNNILTGIFGYTELALFSLSATCAARDHLKEALKAAMRAKELVRQILTFSRQREEEHSPLIVQPVVKEALKLLRASLPSTIQLIQHIDPEAGPILADPSQIHQVIMNLCTNAYHAISSGRGVIEVRVRKATISNNSKKKYNKMADAPYLCISVEDNGSGIEPVILERIFDPYFTTKPAGQGSGMGLAVVHGIVKKCGGEIKVNSRPGHGTAFHLYFPLLKGKKKNSTPSLDTVPAEHPKGTETILAVDDEEHVIDIIDDILSALGYTVVTAGRSSDALNMFACAPEKFDLVLTDHTMPEMTGTELAEKLIAIRPDLPVILYTGFSDRTIQKKAYASGIRTYMTKPVTAKELAVTIRKTLQHDMTDSKDTLSKQLCCNS